MKEGGLRSCGGGRVKEDDHDESAISLALIRAAHSPDDTVCAFSNHVDDLVCCSDVECRMLDSLLLLLLLR